MIVMCGWLSCMRVVMIVVFVIVFFFKQKTAYEMRISDWSSDVCSSDLKEMPIDVSNVAIWNAKTGKGDRVGYRIEGEGEKRRKVRVFKSNSEQIGRASCRERVCQYV